MNKSILLLPVIIFILLGCNDSSTNPSDTKEIWPLKVGNYWVWKLTSYDTLGNVKSEFIDTILVYKDSLWKSEKIYAMKSLGEKIFFEFDFAFNRKDGLYGLNFGINRIDSFLIIKYPGKAGNVFIGFNDTITISETNASYQSAAGNFICYQYSNIKDYDDFSEKFEMYVCPGIGVIGNIVYSKWFNGNFNAIHKTELMSYYVQ